MGTLGEFEIYNIDGDVKNNHIDNLGIRSEYEPTPADQLPDGDRNDLLVRSLVVDRFFKPVVTEDAYCRLFNITGTCLENLIDSRIFATEERKFRERIHEVSRAMRRLE